MLPLLWVPVAVAAVVAASTVPVVVLIRSSWQVVRLLSLALAGMLPSFVLMRRLMLLAWMGTHSHSKESRTKAITYAQGSCTLAERYLSSTGRSLA